MKANLKLHSFPDELKLPGLFKVNATGEYVVMFKKQLDTYLLGFFVTGKTSNSIGAEVGYYPNALTRVTGDVTLTFDE